MVLEEPHLRSAQAQGLLVHAVNRKSRFNDDLTKLAEELGTRLRFVVD